MRSPRRRQVRDSAGRKNSVSANMNRLLTTVLLAVTLLVTASTGSAAARARAETVGSIVWAASTSLNGQAVPPGTPVFAGDMLSTGQAGSVLVRLLSGNSALVGENSAITLFGTVRPAASRTRGATAENEDSGIDLGRGVLTLLSPGPQPMRVNLLQATLNLQGQPGLPSLCRMAVVGRHGVVVADKGYVAIRSVGGPVILPPGKSARLEARPQGTQAHVAGQIVDSMPDEVVLHPGEQVEVPLGLGQLVSVGDTIRTLPRGRVRIQLIGDPYLNVGPGSSLKITDHNPESQYTRIDLSRGFVRAEAARVIKPGGSVEIRTADAIASGAAATFVVSALRKGTEACVIDGTITVRRLNSRDVVQLSENQCNRVAAGQGRLPPAESARRLQTGIYMTTVVGAVAGITSEHPSIPAIATASGTGAAAVLDAIALILISNARHDLRKANSNLGQAASQLDSAGNNLTQAAAEADAADQATQAATRGLQDLLSADGGFDPPPHLASPSTP